MDADPEESLVQATDLRGERRLPVVQWDGQVALEGFRDSSQGKQPSRMLRRTVGDGEDRPAVEALGEELGVADRCRLVGFQQGMREWYAAFDATLLTSANEGTPVVAIESLAAECPVVATRAGGTSTVVLDGESGFLESIGATDRLAGRLAELARDGERRVALGRTGAADVRARFATGRMADELEALYRQLLER